MAIFRGVGGSGSSSDNSFLNEVTAQAQAAEASATSAANSLATIQNTEVTSASFNTGDGVLTLTKTGGATVTADLDGRFLTSYTETNDLSTAVTWANVPDANITQSSVTQHQAALTITESQISDLQSYLTSYTETNNLSTAVTWANVPDANITESSVTQYLTAANVTSPLTGGTGISVASNGTITNDSPDQTVALTGTGATTITGTYPNFTINSVNTTYTVGDGGLTTNDFTDADHTKLNGIEANATADQTGAEIKSAYEAVADTNAFTDAEKTKLSGIEASADVTDATNVTAAGAAMLASSPTFTGTITAPNVDISTTGSSTTNIATGADSDNATDVKVVNIGTGYGGYFHGESTTINMGSQDINAKNIFNIGNGSTTANGTTINLKGDITVGGTLTASSSSLKTTTTTGGATTPVIDLEKNVTGMNGSGRFIEFNTKHHSTSSIVTRGHLGINQSSANGTANPYFSHNDGNCGFAITYSGSSSFNAIVPASTLGGVTSSNINLGHQYARWNGAYLKISPNVSSDREYKRDIEELSEAEKRVAVVCKGLIRKYRMRDAYEEKGENARLHIGIVAQDLQDAFTAEGLDAHRYGMFCSDTWHQATVTTEDEDGNVTTSVEDFELVEHAPEGATNITEITRLSVRYEELLAFIISTT